MLDTGFRLPFAVMLVALFPALPVLAAPPPGIEDLRIERHENEALVGVYVEGDDEGVRVHGLMDDSGAEDAGLERGDVIVSVDGEPVDSHAELGKLVRRFAPGDTVRVGYLRNGEEQSVHLELGARAPRITVEVDRPLYIVSDETRGRIRGTMTLDAELTAYDD